jgi:hypothetical protein
MKLNINGYGQHGKDTVGDLFEELGVRKYNASLIIAEEVMKRGMFQNYERLIDCYNDRVNHRKGWYNLVKNELNREDPAWLVKETLKRGDIFCGHRDPDEYEASRPLFDATIWVHATARGIPKEPYESCKLDHRNHDFIIDNGHSLTYTKQQVEYIYNIIKGQ